MNFEHLSLKDRYYIEIQLKNKASHNKIAKSLGKSQSTISREIKRNTGKRGYKHNQAQNRYIERQKIKPKAIKLCCKITSIIDQYLKEDWSPEQISGRLKKDKIIDIHYETIYQYILKNKKNGGNLHTHLRHQNKTYRKRYGNARNRTGIPNRVDIDERPEVANKRKRIGDWEFDTIIGKNHKGAIVTMDERVTKLRLAAPLERKKTSQVINAMIKLLTPIKEFVLTATFDNGKEFAAHEIFAKSIGCDNYFAKPYHSWERGQNENANGLLRQYFPKKMELNNIEDKTVFEAVDKLNRRPRKILNYLTPYEAFEKQTGVNVRNLMGYAFMT